MRYTIDRFEDTFAILIGDDDSILKTEIRLTPDGSSEGMILNQDKDGNFFIDTEEFKTRQEKLGRIKKLLLKHKK